MPRTVHETDMAYQLESAGAVGAEAREVVILGRPARYEAGGSGTLGVVAFVDFRVGVT